MNKRHDAILKKIYYNPADPAGFSTVEKIYKKLKGKISKQNISKWLLHQETYTRHKPKRIRFIRNRYNIDNIDDLWESDLIDFRNGNMRAANNNFTYILGNVEKSNIFINCYCC